MAIEVRGRGFPAPLVTWTPAVDGVHVRVDDTTNPESWLDVFLPLSDLERYIRLCQLCSWLQKEELQLTASLKVNRERQERIHEEPDDQPEF